VGVVLELDGGAGETAVSFDVDEFGGGDEDIGDGVVAEEGFERAEAEDFVEDLVDDAVLFGEGEGGGLFVDEALHGDTDFATDLRLRQNRDGFEVDPVEEAAVEAEFEFLVLGAGGLAAEEPGDPGGIVFGRGMGGGFKAGLDVGHGIVSSLQAEEVELFPWFGGGEAGEALGEFLDGISDAVALGQEAAMGVGLFEGAVVVGDGGEDGDAEHALDVFERDAVAPGDPVHDKSDLVCGDTGFVDKAEHEFGELEGGDFLGNDKDEGVEFLDFAQGDSIEALAEVGDSPVILGADEVQDASEFTVGGGPLGDFERGGGDDFETVVTVGDEAAPEAGIEALEVIGGIEEGIAGFGLHEEADEAAVKIQISEEGAVLGVVGDFEGGVASQGGGAAAALDGEHSDEFAAAGFGLGAGEMFVTAAGHAGECVLEGIAERGVEILHGAGAEGVEDVVGAGPGADDDDFAIDSGGAEVADKVGEGDGQCGGFEKESFGGELFDFFEKGPRVGNALEFEDDLNGQSRKTCLDLLPEG